MERGKLFLRKGLLMADTIGATVRARVAANNAPSPAYDDEILDWDVPSINVSTESLRIRVRIRDVEAEPMLVA